MKDRGGGTRNPSSFVLRPLSRVRQHAVFDLAPGLLLVFKPGGHREATHAHPHEQRLRVLSGALEVRPARGVRRVAAGARAVRIAAGRAHATRALADTWLIAERLPA